MLDCHAHVIAKYFLDLILKQPMANHSKGQHP